MTAWLPRGLIALLLALAVAACGGPAPQPPVMAAGPMPVCRIGPGGGPPRGSLADRGIGGTGIATGSLRTADRGIGGTGIVGVVTGFASVCVDGLEVAYDHSAHVDIDGRPAAPTQLRVGQVVMIDAYGALPEPQARTISVRNEVSGRIDDIDAASGVLHVAGQSVLVPVGTPNAERFGQGDWVTVGGMRRPDGVIVASRLDPAPRALLRARGRVRADDGVLRLGTLALPSRVRWVRPGDWVRIAGRYRDDQPEVTSVASDRLCSDPAHCFAGGVERLVVQGYVSPVEKGLVIDGIAVAITPQVKAVMMRRHGGGVGAEGGASLAVVSIERDAGGRLLAVGLRYTPSMRPGDSRMPLPPQPVEPPPAAGADDTPISWNGGTDAGLMQMASAVMPPSR